MEGTDSAIYQDIFFQACIVALAPSVWDSLYSSDQRLSVYRHSLFQFGKWRCWFRWCCCLPVEVCKCQHNFMGWQL